MGLPAETRSSVLSMATASIWRRPPFRILRLHFARHQHRVSDIHGQRSDHDPSATGHFVGQSVTRAHRQLHAYGERCGLHLWIARVFRRSCAEHHSGVGLAAAGKWQRAGSEAVGTNLGDHARRRSLSDVLRGCRCHGATGPHHDFPDCGDRSRQAHQTVYRDGPEQLEHVSHLEGEWRHRRQ